MSLNLENFEGEFARGTPYVLTSPTSLEACARVGVQPKDLCYQSIEEYEEIYSDLPLSQVYTIYEKNETRRQDLLLKCRKMRDKIRAGHKDPSGPGGVVKFKEISAADVRYPSDTESHDGDNNGESHHHHQQQQHRGASRPRSRRRRSDHHPRDTYSSRSVPDLRSNLDFHKVSSPTTSPREYCPCQFQFDDERICHTYLKNYCDLIASAHLSDEDRKILERLALKKGRALEWDKKSQEVRSKLEKDRLRRCREEHFLTQRWQDRLAEKRKLENIENTRRYFEIQEKWSQSRENLQRQLVDRDKRLQKYMEEVGHQKRLHTLEKQKAEALRQFEVGKAIEKLMEEDRAHRQRLREQLQKRMKDAEVRKRRREFDYWRHVQEMNRIEDAKRCLQLERVEQSARQTVEELRTQIEDKEHRARMNYMALQRLKADSLCQGSGARNKAMERAQLMHSQLLHGLEEWHKKVLELHLAAQDRAEVKYLQEISRRRARVTSERVLREERMLEMMRRVKENEEKRRELVLHTIDSKESKAARLREEKERKVQISRIRAQQAAELRQQLREKLDPETFDKKAARVELELRVLRKPQANLSHKFVPRLHLMMRRCSHCKCQRK